MPDSVDVSGLAELRKSLLSFPESIQGKASQGALAKAAAPIVRMAKQLAPTGAERNFVGPVRGKQARAPGLLKRSIYSYRNRKSTKTYESRLIGVRGRAWYWRFIEFGRGTIERAKGSLGTPAKGFFGKTVRAVPAKPFLRPAYEALKSNAIEVYRKALMPQVEKYARKAYEQSVRRARKYITGF